MSEIRRFLDSITKKISSYNSFEYLFSELLNEEIPLQNEYSFESIDKKINEIKVVLDKITSIIYSPHIKVDTSPIVVRSETSGAISRDDFHLTTLDPKLWKKKRGEMTPEYVHSSEYIDTIDNYENHFIALLIDSISEEIDDLKTSINFVNDSIEEYYQAKDINFSNYSIFNNYDLSKAPYNEIFIYNSPIIKNITLLLKKVIKRIKNIKGSSFYKVCSKKKISKNILPTNVLIHDELYNYCYRYFKENYSIDEDESLMIESLYYNYIYISLFNYLISSEILNTKYKVISLEDVNKESTPKKKSKNSKKKNKEEEKVDFNNIKLDKESHKLVFDTIEFEYHGFKYKISGEKDTNSILINVSNKFDEANYILKTSSFISKDNLDSLNEFKKNKLKKVDNVYLITLSNEVSKYNEILNLSIYDDDKSQFKAFKNIFTSFTFIFLGDEEIYKSTCPVCGKDNVYLKNGHYACMECNSIFDIYQDGKSRSCIWIKSFRRN